MDIFWVCKLIQVSLSSSMSLKHFKLTKSKAKPIIPRPHHTLPFPGIAPPCPKSPASPFILTAPSLVRHISQSPGPVSPAFLPSLASIISLPSTPNCHSQSITSCLTRIVLFLYNMTIPKASSKHDFSCSNGHVPHNPCDFLCQESVLSLFQIP